MLRSIPVTCAALVLAVGIPGASAQVLVDAPTTQPIITLTASATTSVPNDRMHAYMRAEAEHADAAQAANDVNARMTRALARARGVANVETSTAGYNSFQTAEPNRPNRWRVSQVLSLESSDFAALSALVSKLQSADGLVLGGLAFAVSPAARRAAEDALTQQAITNWQQRAQTAARGFGAGGWRAGRVTIQTSEGGRPQPMFRTSAVAADRAAPVAIEGGMSDVTVTVSGEAILDTLKVPR
jgi:predicted secreted protein